MDHEKRMRKTTDLIPFTPGSSMITRRGQSLFEHDFDSIFDDFRRSFDLMMRPYFPPGSQFSEFSSLPVRYAPLDIIDEGDHFLVHAEFPGFTRENVDVRINNDGVSIRAEKDLENEEKKKNYLHRKRAYTTFERTLSFPEDVDPAKAEGTMKEGVLELRVPKKTPNPEAKFRKIELR